MKVLLAGANSYVGSRLLPFLAGMGHEVVCLARDRKYFKVPIEHPGVSVINGDLLRSQSIEPFPRDIDVAFYLANRLTQTSGFAGLEALSAHNFIESLNKTYCRHIITVSDVNSTPRLHIEETLAGGKAALTAFQTSMIIGEGSVPFQLFNALTQNTPIVITRSWAKTLVQPIYIDDLLSMLHYSFQNQATFNRKFDIGGPKVISIKQMLLIYIASYHEVKPRVVILPLLNDKLASYLVNFLSPTSYPETHSLLQNLSNNSVCHDRSINDIIPYKYVTFKQSLRLIQNKSNHGVLI